MGRNLEEVAFGACRDLLGIFLDALVAFHAQRERERGLGVLLDGGEEECLYRETFGAAGVGLDAPRLRGIEQFACCGLHLLGHRID